VTSVDTDANVVHTHDSGEIPYDKLLVATGGTPTQLPVENSDADGVHHFWTFQDARAIREHAERARHGRHRRCRPARYRLRGRLRGAGNRC